MQTRFKNTTLLLISVGFVSMILTGCYTQMYGPPEDYVDPYAPYNINQPDTVGGANVTIINENNNIMEYPPNNFHPAYRFYPAYGRYIRDPYYYDYYRPYPGYRGGIYDPWDGTSTPKRKVIRRKGSARRDAMYERSRDDEPAYHHPSVSEPKNNTQETSSAGKSESTTRSARSINSSDDDEEEKNSTGNTGDKSKRSSGRTR